MGERPYTVLSCAMSIDGYLDSPSGDRLVLSNDADLDRVDGVRAGCDAILVGAATVRNDDPTLLVRASRRRDDRVCRGLEPSPVKVTVTGGGDLNAGARFFTAGDGEKLVYCGSAGMAHAGQRLGRGATLVDAGSTVDLRWVAEDLHSRGVHRLLVEGGTRVLTQFLTAGLADEWQLVIAPVFVGDSGAPRISGDGRYPWSAGRRGTLVDVRQIGDVALLRYALSPRFGAEND